MDTKRELDQIEKELRNPRIAQRRKAASTAHHAGLLDNNLTIAQEAFCRARALGMSREESAQMAGYKDSTTIHKWEKTPQIKKRISELCEIATRNSIVKAGLDRSWVISRLMTVTERCMQAEPVMVRGEDGDMVPSGEYRFDASGANRALELLGKTMRMFDGKESNEGSDLDNLSDGDIARIAAELAAATGLTSLIATGQGPSGSEQVIELQALPQAD